MRKSLYDKNFRYTQAASDLDINVGKVLKPYFEHYFQEGYSPREIASILHATINDFELMMVLGFSMKKDINEKE